MWPLGDDPEQEHFRGGFPSRHPDNGPGQDLDSFSVVSHIVIPNLFRDPFLILSEDGGPLTDNVAFSSDQRVFVLKRIAVLRGEIPYRSTTGSRSFAFS
ncbi:hypothetical protein V513_02925 [Mesotoga sp. H07.pep.5.3]|nr:hypothetical protein V513_02925 [Mesotoga sp. H07.pep.5.3]